MNKRLKRFLKHILISIPSSIVAGYSMTQNEWYWGLITLRFILLSLFTGKKALENLLKYYENN